MIRKWLQFLGIGLLTAAIGELQFSVFLRGDWENFFGSLFFNAFYLTFAAIGVHLMIRYLGRDRRTLRGIIFLYGFFGLMIEWFLIGNSPWQNPAANQLAMFAYWVSMVLTPIIFLDDVSQISRLKRRLVRYGIGYTFIALLGQLLPAGDLHFLYHIWLFILGYLIFFALSALGYWRALEN